MKKPEILTKQYYDWEDAWDYIKEKYKFECDELWSYICDTKEIYNGKFFSLSNWELVYNNGQFLYLVPDWYQPILEAFINEFGEPDEGCLTPGTKTCSFMHQW
jgi:hypothetical protein